MELPIGIVQMMKQEEAAAKEMKHLLVVHHQTIQAEQESTVMVNVTIQIIHP